MNFIGARSNIFYGWYIVFAAAAINVYGAGVWFYGFPIFFKVLLDEFGWSAAAGAAVISLSRLEGGLEGPIIGVLIDKYGPRKMAIIGAVIAGSGFFLMSLVSSVEIGPVHLSAFVVFVLLYAGWISIGYNTGFGHASMAAVNAWFIQKRSRAFAIYSLGAGGSGLTVFLLGIIVNDYGWRTAAFLSGVGIFVIVIPISLLLRHKPEQYGYLPDGLTQQIEDPLKNTVSVHKNNVKLANRDFTVTQAILSITFWMLVLGTSARAVAMTSVVIHQVNYLTNVRSIPLLHASAALGAMVTVSLVGRLGFGILGDYLDKRYVLIFCTLLQALGIYVLSMVDSMSLLWVFVIIYGISYGGAIPVFMAIIGDYFGRANYAAIRGWIQLFHIRSTMIGPIYAGWVYDSTNSYQVAFMSFIVALVLGTVFLFFARNPNVADDSP